MSTNLIDVLKELQESYAFEAIGDAYEVEEKDPYRNNPIGDCFRELDLLDKNQEAMSSLGETLRGNLCFYQDLRVAKGEEMNENFSIESLIEEKQTEYRDFVTSGETLEMNFATESLVNKAKRAGYAIKINGKELIQKLLTWIKGIYDQYMVADGKLKSYKKLIKKYREKLNTSTPSTKEGKEITIRTIDYSKYLGEFLKAIPDPSTVSTSNIKSQTTIAGLVTAFTTEITQIISHKDLPSAIKDGVDLTSKSAEDIQELVKDKKLVENIKDYLEDLKEPDTDDKTPSEALSYLSSQATSVEAAIKDKKYKKTIDNLVKAANDTMKKINKNKNNAVNDASVESSQQVAALGALVTQYRTHVLGTWTKAITSMLQALLADMAKVINANTSIKKD